MTNNLKLDEEQLAEQSRLKQELIDLIEDNNMYLLDIDYKCKHNDIEKCAVFQYTIFDSIEIEDKWEDIE